MASSAFCGRARASHSAPSASEVLPKRPLLKWPFAPRTSASSLDLRTKSGPNQLLISFLHILGRQFLSSSDLQGNGLCYYGRWKSALPLNFAALKRASEISQAAMTHLFMGRVRAGPPGSDLTAGLLTAQTSIFTALLSRLVFT